MQHPVDDEVHGDSQQGNGSGCQQGCCCRQGRELCKVYKTRQITDHCAPVGQRRLNADTKEGQRGNGQEHKTEPQPEFGQQRRSRIWQECRELEGSLPPCRRVAFRQCSVGTGGVRINERYQPLIGLDIGWKGAVRTSKKVDDDKWHHVVLVYRHKPKAIFGEEVLDDGVGTDKLRIFIDGELAAEEAKFTAPDPDGSVLKIGSAATDFGGEYKGDIDYVRFWRRELPDEEIAALGKGDEAKTNTPLLNWMPTGVVEKEKLVEPHRPDDGESGLRFYATGGQLNFRRCRVEPLAEVDHARLIRGWDHLSLERGLAGDRQQTPRADGRRCDPWGLSRSRQSLCPPPAAFASPRLRHSQCRAELA